MTFREHRDAHHEAQASTLDETLPFEPTDDDLTDEDEEIHP